MFDWTNSSRTALVTNATDGIGYDIARRLAAEGCTVVVHASSLERGNDVLEKLLKDGAEPSRLDLVIADFTELGEIARMARHVTDTHPSLDLLVNTATAAGTERRILTEDGFELTFQINYLAHYLLTRLLEGALSKTGQGRVVSLSSSLHRGGSLNWSDVNSTRCYTPLAVYAQSMLALAMFTKALASLRSNEFTAVSVDPGTTDPAVLRLHGKSEHGGPDGADIVAHLCSPGFVALNGGFYEGLWPAAMAPSVTERSVERLWKLSARLTGLS